MLTFVFLRLRLRRLSTLSSGRLLFLLLWSTGLNQILRCDRNSILLLVGMQRFICGRSFTYSDVCIHRPVPFGWWYCWIIEKHWDWSVDWGYSYCCRHHWPGQIAGHWADTDIWRSLSDKCSLSAHVHQSTSENYKLYIILVLLTMTTVCIRIMGGIVWRPGLN